MGWSGFAIGGFVGAAAAGGDGEPGGFGFPQAREVEDLTGVVGGVIDAAEEGLLGGVLFAADGDGFVEVGGLKGCEGFFDGGPAGVPLCHELGAIFGGLQDELAIAVSVGFFAVGGEEIGPAGAEISGEVFDDEGDGIHVGGGFAEEGFVVEGGDGAFGELAVLGEFVLEVGDHFGCLHCVL